MIKYAEKSIKNWITYSQKKIPDTLCTQLTPTELSQKVDSWPHKYFIDQFGTIPEKRKQTAQRKPQANKELHMLRQQKKECKAARKALLKAGLADTQQKNF